MDSFLVMLAAHYYMQTIPSVNNPPTWMVCPLHTCEACLQAPGLLSLFVLGLSMVGGVLKFIFVPKSAKRPFQKFEVNLVSLSEIIALGNPCNLKFPS